VYTDVLQILGAALPIFAAPSFALGRQLPPLPDRCRRLCLCMSLSQLHAILPTVTWNILTVLQRAFFPSIWASERTDRVIYFKTVTVHRGVDPRQTSCF
jgi:hypothetical protein